MLDFRWRTNGIELDLPPGFGGGHVFFDVAGLAGYRWYLNGEDMGPPELLHQRPLVAVPPGEGHLELRYADAGFRRGLGLAAIGLLLMLAVLRRAERPGPRPVRWAKPRRVPAAGWRRFYCSGRR